MKILFVGMQNSTHIARWVKQLALRDCELHLVPVYEAALHPILKENVIYHNYTPQNDGTNRADFLATVIKKIRPDMVHSFEMQHGAYLTYEARKRFDEGAFPTWVYSCWGSDIYFFRHEKEHAPRIKQILTACNYLYTDCFRDRDLAYECGFSGEFLGAFPGVGGVPVDALREVAQFTKPSQRKKIMVKGYSGWVYRPHVVLAALEWCAHLLSGYEIVIYLAGEGVAERADEIAQRTGLRFTVQPYCDHNVMIQLFGKARVSIASSVSDGTPNSMLEAMIMGAFPIQSDTISTREWIDNEYNGFLAPPESIEMFAKYIECALVDNDMVDAAARRNYAIAKERIDEPVVTPAITQAYRRVLYAPEAETII